MAANRLTAAQREDVLKRIAAGENHATIAQAVGCSIQNVHYHASRAKPQIAVIKEERKAAVIGLGLSEVDARVSQLEWLNGLLQDDLDTGLYGTDVKMSATGKTVEVPVFKAQQVAQLRGTLDDIAKERGGRKNVSEVTGKDGKPFAFTINVDRMAASGGDDDDQPAERPA